MKSSFLLFTAASVIVLGGQARASTNREVDAYLERAGRDAGSWRSDSGDVPVAKSIERRLLRAAYTRIEQHDIRIAAWL